MPRVNIPTNPGQLIDLCVAVKDEHSKQAAASPLTILKWEDISPVITEANELDDQIGKMSRELEKLTERRRTLIEKPDGLADFARKSRDILSGVYRNEMKKLGDFGFQVNDSPKTRKTNGATVTNG